MRNLLLTMLLCVGLSAMGRCYSFGDFAADLMKDSKQVFGKEFSASYFYDFMDEGDKRNKVGVSASVFAYRFITVDPAFIYTPDASDRIGEFGFAFPIRVGKIPIPNGRTIGDWVCERVNCPDDQSTDWIERLFVAPYLSQNLTTGRFGVGINTGIRFGQ